MSRGVHVKFTEEEDRKARQMLEDGAPFREIARTLGRAPSTILRHYQGRGWTIDQVAEFASLQRRFRI